MIVSSFVYFYKKNKNKTFVHKILIVRLLTVLIIYSRLKLNYNI